VLDVSSGTFHHELVIAGFGGQGVVLAGKLVAMAGMAEGREVVWAPSYGPEMRGGAVDCTVIVSSTRIGSPETSLADSLVLMDRTSVARFGGRLKAGGLVLWNSSLIGETVEADGEVVGIPATEEARRLGDQRVANVIMLGALLARRPIVSPESLIGAMRETAQGREALLAVNVEALRRGAALAQS
jgi:2-oxoglutarate ferredoxin oxidoreductase subunit gamma